MHTHTYRTNDTTLTSAAQEHIPLQQHRPNPHHRNTKPTALPYDCSAFRNGRPIVAYWSMSKTHTHKFAHVNFTLQYDTSLDTKIVFVPSSGRSWAQGPCRRSASRARRPRLLGGPDRPLSKERMPEMVVQKKLGRACEAVGSERARGSAGARGGRTVDAAAVIAANAAAYPPAKSLRTAAHGAATGQAESPRVSPTLLSEGVRAPFPIEAQGDQLPVGENAEGAHHVKGETPGA